MICQDPEEDQEAAAVAVAVDLEEASAEAALVAADVEADSAVALDPVVSEALMALVAPEDPHLADFMADFVPIDVITATMATVAVAWVA